MNHLKGSLGESVGIFFFCVANKAVLSRSRREKSKLMSLNKSPDSKKKNSTGFKI